MSQQVEFNGEEHNIPSPNEKGWGAAVTAFLVSVAANAIAASTALVAELDLGATYGIRAKWFRSKTALPASEGAARFARVDAVKWRAEADNDDLTLDVDSSNNLQWEGSDVITAINTQILLNKTYPDQVAITALGAAAASWTKGTTVVAPRFRRDALGHVHIGGALTATGAASATFFAAGTIPAGSRPAGDRVGVGYFLDNSTGEQVSVPLFVQADGRILFTPPPGVTIATDDYLIFSISYLAEA